MLEALGVELEAPGLVGLVGAGDEGELGPGPQATRRDTQVRLHNLGVHDQ